MKCVRRRRKPFMRGRGRCAFDATRDSTASDQVPVFQSCQADAAVLIAKFARRCFRLIFMAWQCFQLNARRRRFVDRRRNSRQAPPAARRAEAPTRADNDRHMHSRSMDGSVGTGRQKPLDTRGPTACVRADKEAERVRDTPLLGIVSKNFRTHVLWM